MVSRKLFENLKTEIHQKPCKAQWNVTELKET